MRNVASGARSEPGISRFRVRRYAPPRNDANKKARSRDRALNFQISEASLRRLIRNRGVVAIGICVGITIGGFGLGLGAAARALGELAFDFLDRFGLG